jgi:beta-lactamase superfamily II metal-dependent hydrolase
MMDALRVRAYDVRFGDAILVSVPDESEAGEPRLRHLLIDVGNVLSGEGGDDAPLLAALADVVQETGGDPVDLYVMTHEHLDHVQGLLHGSAKGIHVAARTVWMTASAEGAAYYRRFPEAKRRMALAAAAHRQAMRRLAAVGGATAARLGPLFANNNPRRTGDCVAHIRALSDDIHYVHRGADPPHPFRTARFEVWAPEEDASDYYGRFSASVDGDADRDFDEDAVDADDVPSPATVAVPDVPPPAGVDPVAFRNLLERRGRHELSTVLAIDRARNNTSVVLLMEWRGRRLLFAGDAELRSWRHIDACDLLAPVDLIKVSHHGSHNGTPAASLLDKLLPIDGAERTAIVSTCADTYTGVPNDATLDALRERATVVSTVEAPGGYVDVHLEPRR